jgi:hypothetical protein
MVKAMQKVVNPVLREEQIITNEALGRCVKMGGPSVRYSLKWWSLCCSSPSSWAC